MFASLLALSTAGMTPQVIATWDDPVARREGIVAERILRPATISPEKFAAALVEAEGLTSWSAQDPTRSAPGERLAWRARHAADGREVVVYFAAASPTACRIRRLHGGSSDDHWRAVRWCAASLGIALPARPASPVRAG